MINCAHVFHQTSDWTGAYITCPECHQIAKSPDYCQCANCQLQVCMICALTLPATADLKDEQIEKIVFDDERPTDPVMVPPPIPKKKK